MPGPYAVRVKTADGWQDLAMLGPAGPTGATGPTGAGVPVGGTTGQVLAKKSATDLDTQWVAQSGGSGAGGHTIQDEGVSLTARTKLNFVGAGVTAVDDVANDRTLVTVPSNATVPFDSLHVIGAAGEIAFGTGWGAWSQCAFRKDPLGKVMFRGTMKSTANFSFGAASATLFTLPVGYRPADNISQKVVVFEPDGATTSMSLCTVLIATSGAVTIQGRIAGVTTSGLSGSYVWLHELDFDTESVIAMPTGPQGPAGGTMDASAFSGDSSGASTALAAATWKTLPCTRAVTVEPASGDYVINGDGSVTVVKAGWYSISATAFFGGGASGAIYLTIGGVPNTEGNWAESDVTTSGALGSTSTSAVKLAAGTQVYVTGYSGAAANNIVLRRLDIARVGGPKGDKGADGVAATVLMDTWHTVGAAGEPAYQNSWATYPGWTGASFRKDPLGRVHLRGLVKSGAIGTTVFTLPVGYRPPATIIVGAEAGEPGGNARLSVVSDGTVSLASWGPNVDGQWLSLSNISFDTETVTAMPTGPQGATGATGGNATVPIDPWHVVGSAGEPAFGSAGWIANAPGLRFRKDPLGRVWIDGTAGVSGGAVASTLFTLPAGYRPKQGITSDNLQTNGAAGTWVGISSAGVVTPSFASGSALYIDVSFDTETVTAMPTGPQGPQGVAGPSTPILVVTSLPVAPVDGQEVYLQSAAMATLGLLWRLRYNAASSSSYKWEFLGGSDWSVEGIGGRDWNGTGQTVTSTGVVDLPDGLGPSISVPVSGIYDVSGLAMGVMQGGAPGLQVWVTGDAAVSWPNVDALFYGSATTGTGAPLSVRRQRTIPAGSAVSLRYTTSNATGGSKFYNRNLYLRPVRVG